MLSAYCNRDYNPRENWPRALRHLTQKRGRGAVDDSPPLGRVGVGFGHLKGVNCLFQKS